MAGIQPRREVQLLIRVFCLRYPHINTAVGIDMGARSFLTVNDGSFINRLEKRLKPPENKIALQQRRIKHKDKGLKAGLNRAVLNKAWCFQVHEYKLKDLDTN